MEWTRDPNTTDTWVETTGFIDWSEASQGDALWDLATITLGYPERLDDVINGYGTDIDHALIRGWWSMRCLCNIRWLEQATAHLTSSFNEQL